MSNSMAIAAVTTTLQSVLFLGVRDELGSGRITALPLDKARSKEEGNQVNLYLYHTAINMGWKNLPKPARPKGTTEKPPLGLDLFYLVTVYGEKESEAKSHRLLGRVMSILHDHSTLKAAEIEAATVMELPESDLHKQTEQIVITPQALTHEEMSQVWRGFQAQYRASLAYQVSVVLIDSQRPMDLALPVLPRLPEGRGAIAQVFPGGATLAEVRLPNRQRSAQWGDRLRLRGTNLLDPALQVHLAHAQWSEPKVLEPLPGGTASELQVQLPDLVAMPEEAREWRAGFYTLSLVIPREQGAWSSEAWPLAIAPKLLRVEPLTAEAGVVRLTVTCMPPVQADQGVTLLLGDRGVPVMGIEEERFGSELQVEVEDIRSGVYVMRLRVDGVDSIPVDFSSSPPQFAENQTLVIAE
ncbi:DUF4255 domain-containing protein [Acaryochloris sp. IP29b_bin.137]|uniref:DUF4255 domain-containing protein n=1 Tax=Acaryochloris sp. IP29b_bin.137 TaxID=2969217 RepID=UPI0026249630|nr:DUF4255 domain-containing protein [Acaryochloris sp. IP29b_bin.137]